MSPEEVSAKLAEVKELLADLLANRAACNLALRNYGSVKRDCADSLRYKPDNAKAYFRQAKACLELRQYEDGLKATAEALRLQEQEQEEQAQAMRIQQTTSPTEAILFAHTTGLPLLLEGPPAIGKTMEVRKAAEVLLDTGKELCAVSNTDSTTVHDYFGGYEMDGSSSFKFVEGPLVHALKTGGWFLADELNLASAEVHSALLGMGLGSAVGTGDAVGAASAKAPKMEQRTTGKRYQPYSPSEPKMSASAVIPSQSKLA